MKHLSEKRFLFWIVSFFIAVSVSCVRNPVQRRNTDSVQGIVSTLFRVEGKVEGQSIRGVRAYFQTDNRGKFMVNLLTAMNSPISTVFFDGERLTVVNYHSRTFYVDKTFPFSPGPGIPFHFDISSLASFYREGEKVSKGMTRSYSWGKLILTEKRNIVVLFNDGSNLLLTPLSEPKKQKGVLLFLKIPPQYRQIDAKD